MGLSNPIATLKAATKDLTWYFAYLLLVSTTGPLLFGFHIVTPPDMSFYVVY